MDTSLTQLLGLGEDHSLGGVVEEAEIAVGQHGLTGEHVGLVDTLDRSRSSTLALTHEFHRVVVALTDLVGAGEALGPLGVLDPATFDLARRHVVLLDLVGGDGAVDGVHGVLLDVDVVGVGDNSCASTDTAVDGDISVALTVAAVADDELIHGVLLGRVGDLDLPGGREQLGVHGLVAVIGVVTVIIGLVHVAGGAHVVRDFCDALLAGTVLQVEVLTLDPLDAAEAEEGGAGHVLQAHQGVAVLAVGLSAAHFTLTFPDGLLVVLVAGIVLAVLHDEGASVGGLDPAVGVVLHLVDGSPEAVLVIEVLVDVHGDDVLLGLVGVDLGTAHAAVCTDAVVARAAQVEIGFELFSTARADVVVGDDVGVGLGETVAHVVACVLPVLDTESFGLGRGEVHVVLLDVVVELGLTGPHLGDADHGLVVLVAQTNDASI